MAQGRNGDHAEPPGARRPSEPEWEEVRLADLVATVHRRRALVASFLVVGLLGSVAATVLTEPAYRASATIVPLEQQDLIKNWLESRQAAELVVQQVGPRLSLHLAEAPGPGSEGRLADALAKQVTVRATAASRGERLLTVEAELPDPVVARDVAAAYVGSLQALRPQLENITRNDAFIKFYDGSNAQDAQRQAEEVARQRTYWLVLDTPLVPAQPSKPQPVLNIALGLAGGLMLGILAVFGAEWLSRYRAEFAGKGELALPAAGPPPEPVPLAHSEQHPAAAPPPPPESTAPTPEGRGFTIVRGARGPAPAEPPAPAKPKGDAITRFWKRS
jgi:hypothetical protein